MTKNYREQAFREFIAFVETYRLESVAKNSDLLGPINSAHKKLYPLLIWHSRLSEAAIWPKDELKTKNFRTYFTETVSDLIQSFFLCTQGMYKPAKLLLRSGIENFVKCLGIHDDQKVLHLTSVFSLIEIVKGTNTVNILPATKTTFKNLREVYGELCKTAHSATPKEMTLTNALNKFPSVEKKGLGEFVDKFSLVCREINAFLLVMFKAQFHKFHFTQRDDILAGASKSVRRIVS